MTRYLLDTNIWNQWSLGAEVSASGLGSDDSSYAARLRLALQF